MNRYYFCAKENCFSHDCQIVKVDDLEKCAKQWKETNGYEHVYVYNMNYDYITNY